MKFHPTSRVSPVNDDMLTLRPRLVLWSNFPQTKTPPRSESRRSSGWWTRTKMEVWTWRSSKRVASGTRRSYQHCHSTMVSYDLLIRSWTIPWRYIDESSLCDLWGSFSSFYVAWWICIMNTGWYAGYGVDLGRLFLLGYQPGVPSLISTNWTPYNSMKDIKCIFGSLVITWSGIREISLRHLMKTSLQSPACWLP